MNSQLIEALLTERAGYVARGLTDRVKQVDAALVAAGYKTSKIETAAVEPEVETAAKPAIKKRTTK